MTRNFLFACLMLGLAWCSAADMPRYIFVNLAPGILCAQDRPETFNAETIRNVRTTLNIPDNPRLRVGVSFFFSLLQGDAKTLESSVRQLLAACETARVPVLITLDGQQWWEDRPDLWNWWDPAKPGYNPDNRQNVEWTSWDPRDAVKIGWRNWGRQLRVAPAPNIAANAFLEANRDAIRHVVPIIAHWYRQLPRDKRWLFGGVKIGNEAGTGYNAFFYPDGNRYLDADPAQDPTTGLDLTKGLSGGMAQLGYAAVKTAGIKSSGTITRDDLALVTQRYLAMLARTVHACGIPTSRIYTHQGGTYPPWDMHIPFTAAVNQYSSPGWSFYGMDPAECRGLAEVVGTHKPWAAAEWWWGAVTEQDWLDHYKRTLSFGNCRFIAIYNWDCGFELRKEKAGLAALRSLVKEWR